MMTPTTAGAVSALLEPAPVRAVSAGRQALPLTPELSGDIQILAVDARPLLRAGLAGIAVRALGVGALPIADLDQAATAMRFVDSEPRALLLGLRAGDDPDALLRHARRIAPTVIFVFDRIDPGLIRAALAAGADGCMLIEQASPDELRATLEAAEASATAVPAELGLHRPGVAITDRCLQVLRGLADGLHDDEIAQRLGISVSSVRKHVANAQLRLGARTRTQTVARAARDGLL